LSIVAVCRCLFAIVLSVLGVFASPLGAAAHAPSGALVDQAGRSFTLGSLRGTPVVVTFVSAHCTDACPLVNAQFADAARRVSRAHLAAHLVTITLDPANDPPSLMRAIAARFDADPRIWQLASGTPPYVDGVLQRFGVVAKPGASGYREAHTTFVYVFDRSGRLASTMLAGSNLSSQIVDAVRALQRKAGT
jgi:protein SCO1/2